MRKTFVKVVTLLGVLGCGQAIATTGEIRTPLARFPFHYPLAPVDDGLWSLDIFSNCYMRVADRAFDKCNGTNKVSLAQLFFGKDSFAGEEAFYGGSISDAVAPAALRFVKMHPRFTYNEKGVNFAVETEKRWDDSKWRVGGQLSLPFKCIEVNRNACSATMTDMVDSFSGAVCRRKEYLASSDEPSNVEPQAIVPAYRLDFLSSLCRADGSPMVEYGIAAGPSAGYGSVRVAGMELAYNPGPGTASAMAVLYSGDSTCPSAPHATGVKTVIARADLDNRPRVSGISDMLGNTPADRSYVVAAGTLNTGANAEVGRAGFNNNEGYTALGTNLSAQSKLYLVPVYEDNPDGLDNTYFKPESVTVMNAIEAAINDLENNGEIEAEQWFYNQGVKFCECCRTVGLGDMDLDLYATYDFTKKFWGKLDLGFVFPTGKKICDPLQLLAQPTGNNGHVEVKLGADFGWKACKWLGLYLDASYNFVLEATEWRAAPFTGATIKNIGPKVQAKTKWGYFTGHFDISVFHPENQNLGFTLGYEPYVKQHDKVKLCDTTATQFAIAGCCGSCDTQNSTAKTLDRCILEKDTKRISHKLRGEMFYRCGYCEIFGGASSVFAGKNIMKENECHVGLGIYW